MFIRPKLAKLLHSNQWKKAITVMNKELVCNESSIDLLLIKLYCYIKQEKKRSIKGMITAIESQIANHDYIVEFQSKNTYQQLETFVTSFVQLNLNPLATEDVAKLIDQITYKSTIK